MSKNGAPKYVDGGRKIMDEDLRRGMNFNTNLLLFFANLLAFRFRNIATNFTSFKSRS